jgi:hypothetical protein
MYDNTTDQGHTSFYPMLRWLEHPLVYIGTEYDKLGVGRFLEDFFGV